MSAPTLNLPGMGNDVATPAGALVAIISHALTPVVMISACATLLLVINSKHGAMADRIRSLADEYRRQSDGCNRRSQILDEIRVFELRHRLTYFAHLFICIAILCFITTIPLLLLSQRSTIFSTKPTLFLFLLGITLMFGAMFFELAELLFSMRSLSIDIRDIKLIVSPTDTPSDGG